MTADPERDLLLAALRGEAAAAVALTKAVADIAWTACQRATRRPEEGEATFRAIMAMIRADGFARINGYDGRSRGRIYIALVLRDLLAEHVIRLLTIDANRGWLAFESFFADDMRRLIARMLPGSAHQQNREDAYQSVCEALLRNNYQRLQSYSGRGSLSGFVLHVIENLIIDYVRTIAPRRRLPAAIQRLPEFDQSVFRLLYWERIAPEPAVLIAHLARGREQPPEVAVIAEAVTRVRKVVPASYLIDMSGPGQMVDLSAAEGASLAGGAEDLGLTTPEDMLIERQGGTLLEGAVAALQRALPKLDAAERLYLQWALSGLPAREIARLTGKAAEDVHKIAQRVKRRLREELSDEDSVKKWRLSVQQ